MAKGSDDGLTPEQRRERDAKALQEMAARKAAAEAPTPRAARTPTARSSSRDLRGFAGGFS